MGFEERGDRVPYLQIVDGMIVRQHKTQAEDLTAVPFTKKDGGVVYRRPFTSITMLVTGIAIGSSTFNGVKEEKGQWKVSLVDQDDGQVYILTMPYSSSYSKSFLNAAASIEDFSKPIRIMPWKMAREDAPDKYNLGVSLRVFPYGDQNKVPGKYSWKEDVPKMKSVVFKGKEQWDDTEQMEFFEKVWSEEIMPKIDAASSDVRFNQIAAANQLADAGDADEVEPSDKTQDDDVPF